MTTATKTTTGHVQWRQPYRDLVRIQEVLRNIKGNGFAHIITRTVPAMRKTNNPHHGNVFKIADVQIQAGFHYINSVNNQLTREGKTPDAEAKPRKWGQRIKGTPLVEHTNKAGEYKQYLEAKCEKVNSVKYVDGEGNEIAKADLAQWLQERPAKSSTQANVEQEVILRDYSLESIQFIAIGGQTVGNR